MGVTGDKSHLKHLGGTFLKGQWIMTTVPFWTKVSSSRQIIFSMQKITHNRFLHHHLFLWVLLFTPTDLLQLIKTHSSWSSPPMFWRLHSNSAQNFHAHPSAFRWGTWPLRTKWARILLTREGWGNKVLLVKVLWWVTGSTFSFI